MVAVSRSLEPLNELKSEFPTIQIISVDLSKWQETRQALKVVGTIDGIVNNAGTAIIKQFEELTEQDFDEYYICLK